jgi:hypothetical protein
MKCLRSQKAGMPLETLYLAVISIVCSYNMMHGCTLVSDHLHTHFGTRVAELTDIPAEPTRAAGTAAATHSDRTRGAGQNDRLC